MDARIKVEFQGLLNYVEVTDKLVYTEGIRFLKEMEEKFNLNSLVDLHRDFTRDLIQAMQDLRSKSTISYFLEAMTDARISIVYADDFFSWKLKGISLPQPLEAYYRNKNERNTI